jgi:hypothetical protein
MNRSHSSGGIRLTNIKRYGRFRHIETGKEVNIHTGKRPEEWDDWHFYYLRGSRVFITSRELRKWEEK